MICVHILCNFHILYCTYTTYGSIVSNYYATLRPLPKKEKYEGGLGLFGNFIII